MSSTTHVVIMGVSGIGKSTVARRLADTLECAPEFAEGDEFHPQSNVAKMASGQPLTDEDRFPWLRALARWVRQRRDAGRSTVVTCSALRRAYRDILRDEVSTTYFVHLSGSERLSRDRMSEREHFMPIALLRSQLETLEPLEPDEAGVVVDASRDADAIVESLQQLLSERR